MKDRNYRNIVLDFKVFKDWLNIPDGFSISSIFDNHSDRLGLVVRVHCPDDSYQVGLGMMIPEVMPMETVHFSGDTPHIWWPDLGQEEPEECPNWRQFAKHLLELVDVHRLSDRDKERYRIMKGVLDRAEIAEMVVEEGG